MATDQAQVDENAAPAPPVAQDAQGECLCLFVDTSDGADSGIADKPGSPSRMSLQLKSPPELTLSVQLALCCSLCAQPSR